jgi:4-diphosphocytidyl-2-C-methyl-D-erythritol kinase
MSERALAAPARAKINLYLHVTGRRSDGYHFLDSLIAFAALGDTVEVRGGDRLSLTVEGPFAATIPHGGDNLVLRAAQALADAAGVAPRARIRLVKRLPAASGIGGGSADAAATLIALGALWNVRPPREDLDKLALALGADVPVCLRGTPAFVGGIGEEIVPAPALPPVWVVLANPGTAVATADVFGRRRGPFSEAARFETAPEGAAALAALLAERGNDLTDPAVSLAPAIATVLAHLQGLSGALLARMSGSGATGFALFADAATAEGAAAGLRAMQPSWWVAATALDAPAPPATSSEAPGAPVAAATEWR